MVGAPVTGPPTGTWRPKENGRMIRLSVVRYLNTTPLVYAFQKDRIDHDFDLKYDVPSNCARKLKAMEADVGIIPSIEYARSDVPYRIVPDISIS
ncbi:uncharacterized protein METZ01_LOCUS189550, partial [marine metagenome]